MAVSDAPTYRKYFGNTGCRDVRNSKQSVSREPRRVSRWGLREVSARQVFARVSDPRFNIRNCSCRIVLSRTCQRINLNS